MMRFRSSKGRAVQLLGMNISGEERMLSIAFIGSVEFKAEDSEELAKLLSDAAEMVREHK